jgi:hypothetical protein
MPCWLASHVFNLKSVFPAFVWPKSLVVEFGKVLSIAGGAHAMTEICVGVFADVLFNFNPCLLIGLDPFTIRTDGQEPA